MGNFLGLGVQRNHNTANTNFNFTDLISKDAAAALGSNAASKLGDSAVQSAAIARDGFVQGSGIVGDALLNSTRIASDGLVRSSTIAGDAVVRSTGIARDGLVNSTGIFTQGITQSASALSGALVDATAIYSLAGIASSAISGGAQFFSARELRKGAQSMGESHRAGLQMVSHSVDGLGGSIVHGATALGSSADKFALAHSDAAGTIGKSMVQSSPIIGVQSAVVLAGAIDRASIRLFNSVIWLGIFAMCCSLTTAGYVSWAFWMLSCFIAAANARKITTVLSMMQAELRMWTILGILFAAVTLLVLTSAVPETDTYVYLRNFVGRNVAPSMEDELVFRMAVYVVLFLAVAAVLPLFQHTCMNVSLALRLGDHETRFSISLESFGGIIIGALLGLGLHILLFKSQ